MSESFNLSFTNAEHDLYTYLKGMTNASAFLKGAIKSEIIKSEMNEQEQPEAPAPEQDIDSQVKSIFDRVFGDIFSDYGGEYKFIRIQNECQTDIYAVIKARKDQVNRICNGDSFLFDSTMEYARDHLPKLGRYL